jgi:phospholipid/cholesterol/gamma-HCH transport system substrate-binding protein
MEYRSNEIKAGCIVVLGIVLFVVFLVLISGLDLFKPTKIYLARFKYTSGIEIGSLVRYGGFEVGIVKQVRIAPDNNSLIEFEVEIDAAVPVKQDSEVLITSIGIMGEYYIEISTGSTGTALLPPGSLMNCKDATPMMMLTDKFGELSESLSQTIDQLNQLLGSQNRNQVQLILTNLNRLLEDNQNSIAAMMENSGQAIANLSQISNRLDTLLLENQDSISRSIQNLEATLLQSQSLIKSMQEAMKNVDNMIVTQDGNYENIMENLNRTSKNLDEFTRSIKERPWSLIRKSAPPERDIR